MSSSPHRRFRKAAEIVPLFRTKQQIAQNHRIVDPTTETYRHLRHAYDFFNRALFEGKLPPCLITVQRKKRTLGYFWGKRFESFDGAVITDEIALNPSHFSERGDKDTLSTLLHEMVHLWQHHFGEVSRPGYHNTQWAETMVKLGLIPTATGAIGGKVTGQRMTHVIKPGGPFDRAAYELIAKGFVVAFVEQGIRKESPLAIQKRASKTRFSCTACSQRAWAKAGSALICGRCNLPLV